MFMYNIFIDTFTQNCWLTKVFMVQKHYNQLNNQVFFDTHHPPFLSIVVPVYNEASNLALLIQEINQTLDGQISYEIIYVDDGSRDESWELLQSLVKQCSVLRIVRHRRSYGQSVAILTGVKLARAEWIVTLDGDGQNDPADIWKLLEVLKVPQRPPRLHLIAGKRYKRQDTWIRRISSKIANGLRSALLQDNTSDTGCGLKLFSRKTFLALPHFNHMHRFLPALFLREGSDILFVEVNHRPRQRGQSKYGVWNRLWKGLVDTLGVMWLQRRHCLAEIIEELPKK